MNGIVIALLIAAINQGSPATAEPLAADAVQAAPMAEYAYPGATPGGSSKSGGVSADLRHVVLTTPDLPDAVLAFYEAKFGASLGANCFHGRPDGWVASVNDSRGPDTGEATSPPVTVHVLTQETSTDVVTIVISRAPGESDTHIVMLFVARR